MKIRPYTVTVEPSEEPVTLAEGKAHLGVTDSADDDLITALIVAARDFAEGYIQRKLITQTIRFTLSGFPSDGVFDLPQSPAISVSSIGYKDTDGNDQTLDSAVYELRALESPPQVSLVPGQSWPSVYAYTADPVTVTATVGYGAAADVPQTIKSAIKLTLTKLYDMDTREGRYLDDSIAALLRQHKAWWA